MLEPQSLKPHLAFGFEPEVWRIWPGTGAGWELGSTRACRIMLPLRSIVKRRLPHLAFLHGVSLSYVVLTVTGVWGGAILPTI